jgi:hypothetical protein
MGSYIKKFGGYVMVYSQTQSSLTLMLGVLAFRKEEHMLETKPATIKGIIANRVSFCYDVAELNKHSVPQLMNVSFFVPAGSKVGRLYGSIPIHKTLVDP